MHNSILAFDTTTEACSAALMINNKVLADRFIIAPRAHTKFILSMIDSLLKETGVNLNNLDALAFSRGPGSFNGVRISISVAQGLALGANLPLIGISTLATLAEGAWRRTGLRQVLVITDASYMGKIYYSTYQRKYNVWLGEDKETVIDPVALSSLKLNLVGKWATAGNGWRVHSIPIQHDKFKLISGKTLFPRASDMLPIALYYFRQGKVHTFSSVKPSNLYSKVLIKDHNII